MAELVVKLVNGELAGRTMQGITKEVSAATLALKKAEIGTEDWVKAHAKLESAKKLQGDLKKQIDGTTGASNLLKGAFLQIPGADKFNAIVGSFTQMKSGMGGLTSASGLLKGAMMAIPIFLVITAITTLVSWFKKTEDGANTLSGIFKAMGNVFDVLISKIWNIGTTLKEFLANPIQFFKNLGNDIAGAAKEGYNLVQVFDDIEDRQRDLAVKSKEQDILVDQLMLQAKNAANTYGQKIDLLKRADEITRASYQEQLALSKEYLDAVDREIEQAKKSGTFGDELADKRKDAALAYLDLKGQEITTEEKIANRREMILGKQEKAQEKVDADKQKQQEKDAAALETSLKQLEDMRVQAIADSEQQEIAAIQLKFQRMLEESTLEGAQRLELEKLIEETKGQEIQVIRDKYLAAAAAKDKKAIDDSKARTQEKTAFEQRLGMQRLENESMVVGGLGDLITANIKDEKEAKAIKKTFGLVDVGINLAKELSANSLAAAANPLNAVTFGAAGAAQLAIANTASFIRAGIAAVRIAAFKKGGIPDGVLRGPSHEDGGIPLVAEGQEIIMTKGVYQNDGLRSMASAINVAGGGRSFAAGGPSNPFDSSRGPVSSGRASGGSTSDPFSRLESAILAQTAAINKRIDRIQVVNNLQDTEKGLKTLNTLRSEADV